MIILKAGRIITTFFISAVLASFSSVCFAEEAESPFMAAAIEEAYEGIEHGHGGPFGSVIVRDGEIIGSGHNRVLLNNDPTCHGEVDAIRSTCAELGTFDLSGCELYTTGEPCPMCLLPVCGPISIRYIMDVPSKITPKSASVTLSSTKCSAAAKI